MSLKAVLTFFKALPALASIVAAIKELVEWIAKRVAQSVIDRRLRKSAKRERALDQLLKRLENAKTDEERARLNRELNIFGN